jgi:hypothetical protein
VNVPASPDILTTHAMILPVAVLQKMKTSAELNLVSAGRDGQPLYTIEHTPPAPAFTLEAICANF